MAPNNQRLTPEEWVIAGFLAIMVVLNFTGILARYWLHISLPWIEEVEVGLFVWTVLLGAGLTVVRDIHLGFSALVDRMPAWAQTAALVWGRGAFLLFFGLLTWFGISMVANEAANQQRTPTLAWPEWLIGGAIPVGAALAVFRIIQWAVERRRT